MVALTVRRVLEERVAVEPDWLSIALPRPADTCFALFTDVERIPAWLTIVRSAVITARDEGGLPREAAYLCSLRRATVGYTLTYRYRRGELRVDWSTPARASLRVRGFAEFQALGPDSCLMTYGLDLGFGRGLPRFDDAAFDAHATSATMADFRDYVMRS
jgi:uncharacterized membrane protein